MNTVYKILGAILAISLSFAYGRYSAPQSIDKSIETTKNDVVTIIKEVAKSDGTKEITTTITDKSKESRKESNLQIGPVTRKPVLNVSVLTGYGSFNLANPYYGISVSKEVFGPITAGVFALNSGILGLSVGVNF